MAQPPVQVELVALSPAWMYRVMPSGPTRTGPRDVVAIPMVTVELPVEATGVAAGADGAVVGGAVVAPDEQAATSASEATRRPANRRVVGI